MSGKSRGGADALAPTARDHLDRRTGRQHGKFEPGPPEPARSVVVWLAQRRECLLVQLAPRFRGDLLQGGRVNSQSRKSALRTHFCHLPPLISAARGALQRGEAAARCSGAPSPLVENPQMSFQLPPLMAAGRPF
jgi:hypothetical protein